MEEIRESPRWSVADLGVFWERRHSFDNRERTEVEGIAALTLIRDNTVQG